MSKKYVYIIAFENVDLYHVAEFTSVNPCMKCYDKTYSSFARNITLVFLSHAHFYEMWCIMCAKV
jgi:hypothetical protein